MSRKNLGDLRDLRTLIAATRDHSLDPRYLWGIADAWRRRKDDDIADLIIARHHSDHAYYHIVAINDQMEYLQPITGEDEDEDEDDHLSLSPLVVSIENELERLERILEIVLNRRLQSQETYA